VKTPAQAEIEVTDLVVGQPVRMTFRRPDNSWREVIWTVLYADERSAVLKPRYNAYDHKKRLFDAEQVQFWDAKAVAEVFEKSEADA